MNQGALGKWGALRRGQATGSDSEENRGDKTLPGSRMRAPFRAEGSAVRQLQLKKPAGDLGYA